MDLSGSLRERLTWKAMYKCTMQALRSRNNFNGIINKFDFIKKNMNKPCVYKKLGGVMSFPNIICR
jgi:hypothetical protein